MSNERDAAAPLHAHLARLFDHLSWADDRVLTLLRTSSGEDPDADAMRLMSHLLAAERVWLLRLAGEDSSVQAIWPDLSLAEMERMSQESRRGYTEYLGSLEETGGAERVIEYKNSKGTPFRTSALDILTHVALHGSYHRGQVAQAVRGAGRDPVNTDYIIYARDHP